MAALVVLLTACGEPAADDGVGTLAKADGWRAELNADEWIGGYLAVVEIAYDEATAGDAWRDNVPDGLDERSGEPRAAGRYGDLADVDFADQVVVVYSSGQSGACPAWLADISVQDGTVELSEDRHVPGNACTDDFNPYRLLLAVDRDRVPAEDGLPTEQVRVDGRDLSALVTAYPAVS